ncbi:hypothetical protein EYF80_014435 [Liparis tanakae]|uniref:Uncharacterized protein n=1 Tax=Liparis tanakae TaxID=230148 RepID=A0A4Z2IBK0_9TELE|nr:hypothetical protein EYF80_014435 [Liparis tanakae]
MRGERKKERRDATEVGRTRGSAVSLHTSVNLRRPGANILLAQAADCWMLVYLALGSIRLRAEASHSSQSHKIWIIVQQQQQARLPQA